MRVLKLNSSSDRNCSVMNSKVLHEQLSIIMGALTKAAVAEICEVVDEGYAVLQMEIIRSHNENEDLKKKLHLIESIIVRGSSAKASAEAFVQAVSSAERSHLPESAQSGDAVSSAGTLELPDVVLIKDEESDSNGTYVEGIRTSADERDTVLTREGATSTSIRRKKRQCPGGKDAKGPAEKSSCDQQPRTGPASSLSTGKHRKVLTRYSLDYPCSEPSCSSQPGADEKEAGDSICSFSPHTDPDMHLGQQESSLAPPVSSADRQAMYCGGHDDVLVESQTPTTKGELDVSLTWTKPSKSQGFFAQLHHSEGADSDAFGLKLTSVSGSTSRDCQLSESSSPAFDFEDADMMNFGFYRDPSSQNQQCGGQPGAGAKGKRFVCSICSKTYATAQNLDVHMRIHTGERPFICAQCGKKFTQSAHLKSHQSVHTGERPYTCKFCSKSFIVKYSLKLHTKKCHSTTAGTSSTLSREPMTSLVSFQNAM